MAGYSSAVYSAKKGVAVTPSDTTVIETTRGLYVGTTGNISVVWADGGAAVPMTAVAVGEHAWQVSKVMATNTTASNIVALY